MMDDKVKKTFNEWMENAKLYEEGEMYILAYKRYVIAHDIAKRCEDESYKLALEGIKRCKKKIVENNELLF